MTQNRPGDEASASRRAEQRFRRAVQGLVIGDEVPTPESVVEAAAQAVPHSQAAGLTLLRRDRRPVTVAASDELPREVDDLQYRLMEGPCLVAATGPSHLISDDVLLDQRWPRFGPRCAARLGVRSMMSLRLPVGDGDHAGINFYATEVEAFTDADLSVATHLVPLAALALEAELRAIDSANLKKALESNRAIGTAVGIVMATLGLRSEDAFEVLRRASMDRNRKLVDIADEVNHTGALPPNARHPADS